MNRLRRWPPALLLVALLVSVGCRRAGRSGEGEVLPLAEGDKAEAARMVVAWSLQGKHPDVVGEGVPPWAGDKDVMLLCEFLPHDEALTLEPRVNRVGRALWEGAAERPEPGVVLIRLYLTQEGPEGIHLSVTASGAHEKDAGRWRWGRAFEVRRTSQGLKAKVRKSAE